MASDTDRKVIGVENRIGKDRPRHYNYSRTVSHPKSGCNDDASAAPHGSGGLIMLRRGEICLPGLQRFIRFGNSIGGAGDATVPWRAQTDYHPRKGRISLGDVLRGPPGARGSAHFAASGKVNNA